MAHRRAAASPFFMFATGIEKSAPTIRQGALRVDTMARVRSPQTLARRLRAGAELSPTDQVDWDTALREDNGRVNPLGLFDLDRRIRPAGTAYKQLIADWREVLPTMSVCLQVPVVMPGELGGPWAERQRAQALEAAGATATAPANVDSGHAPSSEDANGHR